MDSACMLRVLSGDMLDAQASMLECTPNYWLRNARDTGGPSKLWARVQDKEEIILPCLLVDD